MRRVAMRYVNIYINVGESAHTLSDIHYITILKQIPNKLIKISTSI